MSIALSLSEFADTVVSGFHSYDFSLYVISMAYSRPCVWCSKVVFCWTHGQLTAVSMPLLMQVHTSKSVALNTHGCLNKLL